MGLSAVLIVKNEEKNIADCLEALAFADEIIVVDSGSSDRTLELARAKGAKTSTRAFDDFASQKNYAAGQASYEWILSIDADERVSEPLRAEILNTIASSEARDAYAVHRKTNFFGRDFRASGLQDDAPIRLFRRGRARFENPVHEIVRVDGRTGKLKAPLYHRSFQTIKEHLAKLQHYTEVEAQKSVRLKKTGFLSAFFMRPFYRFFSLYVLKLGFRDGLPGFFYAVLSGYYEWVRQMKIWEITRSCDRKEP